MESGTFIKGYELRERIGSGGFGVVHRAYQSTISREVAIKIILPKFANHPDFIRRFEIEAHVIARLEHPFIVPLFDYWRDPEGAYLVMRFMRGGSLQNALKANGLFELQAVALLLDQVTSALNLAHHQGIIHRDLKPGNILLDDYGYAYLADFGIAKDITGTNGGITSPDAMIGSPDYLAPEQARSEPVTPQTDIYSLGVVLYEMLAGEHPFPNITPVERMYKHLNDSLPSLTTLPPDMIDEVNYIIQKATAKNPAQRFADVLELSAAFREATGLHRPEAREGVVEQLTRREQEILQLIIDGDSNRDIAKKLFVELGTVKWHIRQLYKKLRVRNRVQAIVRARELNLIVGDTEIGESPGTITTTQTWWPEPENPYKGLRAFQTIDAPDFFGREKTIQKLVSRLCDQDNLARFLAIVGPSGSGKSSLVKAGLIPALLRGDLPESDRWFVVDMMPGYRPLDELEITLSRVAADQATNLREHLIRDRNGLLRIAGLILPNDGSELVIVIDQFEEVFTLGEDEDERVQFLDLIHAAVTTSRSRVRIVVTMRADFYDRPLHYPEFGELMRNRMETVLPLSAQELEKAIVKPAERVGVKYEESLAAAIIDEVLYQPGALPLLQYALTELFEQRDNRTLTLEGYQAIGGTVGALAKRAGDLYREYDAEGREAIRQMFLRLVMLGEGKEDTRRRVPRSELIAVADGNEDLMDDIINAFAEYRLLSLDHDPATRSPTVELAHEAILREWDHLRMWLDDSREDIRLQRTLSRATKEWQDAGQDSSYLLRGSRLSQYEAWAADAGIALTHKERGFLDASLFNESRAIAQRRLIRNAVLAAAVIVAVIMTGLALVAVDRERAALEQERQAHEARAEAQELALVNGARAALANEDLDTALALAVAANQNPNPSAPAQLVLSQAAYTPGTRQILDQAGAYTFELSPDERTMLTGSYITDSGSLILWDTETGEPLHELQGHTTWVVDAVYSPDGSRALSTSYDYSVRLWDLQTGEEIRRFEFPQLSTAHPVWRVVFHPDGRTALGSVTDDEVKMVEWDIETGAITRLFTTVEYLGSFGLDITQDGRMAMTTGWDGSWVLWDLDTGEPIHVFSGILSHWTNGCFNPDGRTALTGQWTPGRMVLWDTETFEVLRTFESDDPLFQITCSRDGTMVLTDHATVNLWAIETGRNIPLLGDHGIGGTVDGEAVFGPGQQTVYFGNPGSIRVWDIGHGAELRHFEPDLAADAPPEVTEVSPGWNSFSPDGSTLFLTTQIRIEDDSFPRPGARILFDVATGEEILQVTPHDITAQVFTLNNGGAFSPDGQTVVTAENTGQLHQWDVQTGDLIRTFIGHRSYVTNAAYSPDGLNLVSAGTDDLAILWDATTGQEIRRLAYHEEIWSIAITPDGLTALLGTEGGEIVIWNLETGQVIQRLQGHDKVTCIAVHNDGETALSGGANGLVILWDLTTFQDIRRFVGHSSSVNSVAFGLDGQSLFSAGVDGLFQWEIDTGEAVRHFPGEIDLIFLQPENNSLLVTDFSNETFTVRQFQITTAAELLEWTLANRYVRDLTCNERELYHLEPLCPSDDAVLAGAPDLTPADEDSLQESTAHSYSPALLPAQTGENRGEVPTGGSQVWLFEGTAGERLSVQVQADYPANWDVRSDDEETPEDVLDTLLTITSPDGRVLTINLSNSKYVGQSDDIEAGINTDSAFDLIMTTDGTYRIEVSGKNYETSGSYTLYLATSPAPAETPPAD